MHLIDRLEPALAQACIITRSDRAPTNYERYGAWARKFFGYGYHQTCKDGERVVLRKPGPNINGLTHP